jgi:hypothetical protein
VDEDKQQMPGQHQWAAEPVPGAQAEPPPAAPAGGPSRARLALVGGAIGLLAAGGIGGFVVGQSTSSSASTSVGQMGGQMGGPPSSGGQEGFSGQLPGTDGTTGTGQPTG